MNFFLIKISELYPIGRIKYAPGTIASMFTAIIYFIFLIHLNPFQYFFLLAFLIPLCLISIKANLKNNIDKDPKEIVIDELLGQIVAIFPVFLIDSKFSLEIIILSFLTFRFFDITKVGLKKIEQLDGPLGVLLDDVVAAIYSIIVQLLFWNIFL